MRSHTNVLVVALLAAIVITAILVVGVSGGSEPQTKPPTRQTTSAVKPVSNRQAFAVLARPASDASRQRLRAARARTLKLDPSAVR